MENQGSLTLGSLFDGIGGFPFAGSFFGIKPLWASEILPQAVSVTKRHFMEMAHVGDLTKLDGAKLPPVDIITFGSPCQDLSTAGKRAGMGGSRSGLFYEAIRIIDEMREETNGNYPRYAVWENVPGALSSGNPRGSDFRAVLEAFTKTEVPVPDSGNWANAGLARSGRADIAWRLLNACLWGVPQRRRRIFLVASFGAGCPGEILFVEDGLRRHLTARGQARQGAAAAAERGVGSAVRDGRLTPWDVQSRRIYDDAWPALYGGNGGGHGYAAANCLNPWDNQQRRVFDGCGTSPTLAGADGSGGRNPGGLVFQDAASQPVGAFCGGASAKARSIGYSEDVSPTLKAVACGFNAPCVCEPDIARTLTARGDDGSLRIQANFLSPNADGGPNVVAMGVHQNQVGRVSVSETAYTLNTNSNATGRNAPLVAHPDVAGTLCASGAGLSRPAGMASEPDLCVAYALAGNMVGRQDRNGPNGNGVSENLAFTLNASDVQNVAAGEPIPIHDRATRHNNGGCGNGLGVGEPGGPAPTLTEGDHHMVAAVDCRNFKEAGDCSGTLQAKNNPGWSLNFMNPVRAGYIVRRLTPTECERLQGFPDGWTALGHDGKEISDTRRYQMLGNSVAIPCVAYVLGSIAAAEARRG